MNAVLKSIPAAVQARQPDALPPLSDMLAKLALVSFIQVKPPRPAPEGYWTDREGRAVHVEDVADYEQLREETLRPLVSRWLELYLAAADLKARLYDDIEALLATCAEEHGVSWGGKKGNVTLYLFDGSFRVERNYQNRTSFDEQITAAEVLVRECLDSWADGARPELRQLVMAAFGRNACGEIRRAEMVRLRELRIEDERWERAMNIIAKAEKVLDRACYIVVSVRDANGKYHPLPLDMASIRAHKSQPTE